MSIETGAAALEGLSSPRARTAASPAPRGEFTGQRLLDCLLACATIGLASPVILLRAACALLTTGRLLQDQITRPAPARFAGACPGAGLAALFSAVAGSYTLAQAPADASRPGLVSRDRLRSDLGVNHLADSNPAAAYSPWGIRAYMGTLLKALLASPVRGRQGGGNFHLFGVRIVNSTMPAVLDDLSHAIDSENQTCIAFANADCMNKCFTDGDYHLALRAMDRVFPDGIGVRLAAQMFGNGVQDNINGTDLFPLLCQGLAGSGHGLFLLGARPGIAGAVADNMSLRYPGLKISGTRDGYFTETQEEEVIAEINRSGASVLLVAFGAPRQELWISRHRDRLEAKLIMGVGGLFDFYSGRIERAPVWMREVGLEWIWRLMQEPARMWRRYIVGNPLFLYRVWNQKRRNGSVARALQVTPAEEASVLEHYAGLLPLYNVRPRWVNARQRLGKLARAGGLMVKRLLDIVVSATMLILLSPLFLAVIVAIRTESPGPAFYSQMRVGYRGREFKLRKFRSMYRDAEARRAELEAANEMAGGVIFKMKKDPRITRTGRIIRKTSIDELPQLWNVLTGDMSLVGPRPALASEVALYSVEERVRLMSRPGLTCFWQVAGRSEIPFDQQVLLDEDYLYRQSVFTDIKLLLQTVPAVVRGKGAY